MPFSIMWYQIFPETESYLISVGKQEKRVLLAGFKGTQMPDMH